MISKLEICNNALDLAGQGIHIKDLDEKSRECDLCKSLYDSTIERALVKYNFSFSRKDEVITKEMQVDHISLPWRYSYSIPSDCLKILYLAPLEQLGGEDSIHNRTLDFNFRQTEGQTVICTNVPAPFVVHYQAKVTDESLFSAGFTEAVEYLLAARIAPALIHGTTGIQVGQSLMQFGFQLLDLAAGQDSSQGASSITDKAVPSFVRARGGFNRD